MRSQWVHASQCCLMQRYQLSVLSGQFSWGRGSELKLCNHSHLTPLTSSILAYVQTRWGPHTRDNDALLLHRMHCSLLQACGTTMRWGRHHTPLTRMALSYVSMRLGPRMRDDDVLPVSACIAVASCQRCERSEIGSAVLGEGFRTKVV